MKNNEMLGFVIKNNIKVPFDRVIPLQIEELKGGATLEKFNRNVGLLFVIYNLGRAPKSRGQCH